MGFCGLDLALSHGETRPRSVVPKIQVHHSETDAIVELIFCFVWASIHSLSPLSFGCWVTQTERLVKWFNCQHPQWGEEGQIQPQSHQNRNQGYKPVSSGPAGFCFFPVTMKRDWGPNKGLVPIVHFDAFWPIALKMLYGNSLSAVNSCDKWDKRKWMCRINHCVAFIMQ